jgi:hypothetical protein
MGWKLQTTLINDHTQYPNHKGLGMVQLSRSNPAHVVPTKKQIDLVGQDLVPKLIQRMEFVKSPVPVSHIIHYSRIWSLHHSQHRQLMDHHLFPLNLHLCTMTSTSPSEERNQFWITSTFQIGCSLSYFHSCWVNLIQAHHSANKGELDQTQNLTTGTMFLYLIMIEWLNWNLFQYSSSIQHLQRYQRK